jgi:hypothetical protein
MFEEVAKDIGASTSRFNQDPIIRANVNALFKFIAAVRQNELPALLYATASGDEPTRLALIRACGEAMTMVAQWNEMIALRVQRLERQSSAS